MKAIETEYNGYRFRSRLEARWAVFFDKMGIRYEYEPEGLVLSDGTYYLPDFYLPDFHCYFEVKRAGLGKEETRVAIDKISAGWTADEWAGVICFGDPVDDRLLIFCQETDDGGGGGYDEIVTFGFDPRTGNPTLFAWDDYGDRVFWTSLVEDDSAIIPMITNEGHTIKYDDVVTKRVIEARKAARQARFEHGKRPVTRE